MRAEGDSEESAEKLGAVPDGSTTDSDVGNRELESSCSSGEKFEFQADISRLINIIINSQYSDEDIFLRELISNASNALDKIRERNRRGKEILGEDDTTKLEIQIKLDKKNKILSIRDRGIGMTKEDLIQNLGTVAKSGTSALVEKMQTSRDLNLIGEFGVGFYSVYLVADYVEVISKHKVDEQYVWKSKADGAFTISEDSLNEPLGRGTEIRLHLREKAGEYLEESKLKDLVKRYKEFSNFPIKLWATKEIGIDVEIPVDEDDSTEQKDEPEDNETEKGDEEEPEDNKPKTQTVKEITQEWELLNDVEAIWVRSPKDVTEEEYTKLYHSLSKDFCDAKPMSWSHFTDVEFKAVLFVPPKAPHDLYESYYNNNKSNLKLYVRRVFISDEFDELLPKYLSFLKGLVDSDTLPLNVSREMLQQHSSLKTIKKKLIRKALDMIRKLYEEDPDESTDKDKKDIGESGASDKKGQYAKFWNEFGKSIKLGIIEDAANRNRLSKLLRFKTTTDGKLTSLDQYISRMKSGQKDIFYITGTDKEQLAKSPFLKRRIKKGYEVIYFAPVDEYLMQYLMDYEDKKFQDVSKEGVKIAGVKELKEAYKNLTKWWKTSLASWNVDDVKVSNRLADTPCVGLRIMVAKDPEDLNDAKAIWVRSPKDVTEEEYTKFYQFLSKDFGDEKLGASTSMGTKSPVSAAPIQPSRSDRLETVEMANWCLFPTTLPKTLGKPKSGSLFFWIFQRVPDTCLWFAIAMACYAGHIYEFQFTKVYKQTKGKVQWLWISLAFALGIAILAFFHYASRLREANGFRREYGVIARTVGFLVGVGLGVPYLWLGESTFSYCFFLLLVIAILTVAFLAIRPSTDFNVVNGLIGSLLSFTFRALKNAEMNPRSFHPFIIVGGSFFLVLLRFYFETRGVAADKEGSERKVKTDAQKELDV